MDLAGLPVLTAGTDVAGDLVLMVLAAVVGGYAAHLARLPLALGYLVGGVLIGPSVGALVGDVDRVAFVAELGVALLLFSIGLEFSFEQFRRLGRSLGLVAAIQIVIVGLGGFALARTFGLGDAAATLVAGAAAFSSTALVVRVLAHDSNRRRSDRRWVLGLALAQDLVAVPLLVVLPQLGDTEGADLAGNIAIAGAKGIGLVAVVLVLGRLVVPRALGLALGTRSRELFLLTTFALAGGVALGSFALGLSVAFGAFLAGLLAAQSPYATRALHELIPLRDLFAATFFVSIGMLLDFTVVGDDWDLFLTVLLWGSLGKTVLIFFLARRSGFDASRALMSGLLLGQVGEFAFLMAQAAAGTQAEEGRQIVIAVAAVSMALSAVMIRLGPQMEQGLLRLPGIAAHWSRPPTIGEPREELRQHTIIAGYGETGREVVRALQRRGFRYLVVDSDPNLPRELDGSGIPYIWGDLANPATLDEAGLEHARVLAVTVPDAGVAEAVVHRARQENPRLMIVARGDGPRSHPRLLAAGANTVVQPDLEVGLQIAFQALHRYGVSSAEIRLAQVDRRRDYPESSRDLAAGEAESEGGR